MRPTEVTTALTALLPTGRPVFLWGPPGSGKSSLIRRAAGRLDLKLIDVRAAWLDPVDLRGLPHVANGLVRWAPPAFLPKGGCGILLLDDLTSAPPLVQAAGLQLVLDRRLGAYELPPGWSVVAAGTNLAIRAASHPLIASLRNRFLHLDLEVNADDWQAWALAAGVAPDVRAFLRFRPALLHQFDPYAEPRTFPTPRSWHAVSDVLSQLPEHLRFPVIAGCVGEGPAAEFLGHIRLAQELPDLDALLLDPDAAPVPREPAVVLALIGALVEECWHTPAPLDAFVKYVTRLPAEFTLLALRDAIAVNHLLASHPAVKSWLLTARTAGLLLSR